jgi:drug/metabolite transporter (DMT)-like permease
MIRCRLPGIPPIPGLLLACLIWGGSFPALKAVLTECSPLLAIGLRLVIAAPLFLWLRPLAEVRYRPGDWRWLLLMALCEPVLYFLLETHALRFTTSAAAATIVALLPLVIAVAAYYLLRETVTARLWRGLAVTLVGTLLLTVGGEATDQAPRPWLGNLLEALAMLTAVGYTLLVKHLSRYYPPLFLTAVQTWLGGLLLVPSFLLPGNGSPAALSGSAWLGLLYLGSLVSVGAYFLYNHALSALPASRVAVTTTLIPVFAALFGWLLLGETLTLLQTGAMLLVLTGVCYSQGLEFTWRGRIPIGQYPDNF